jgi:DNA-packaging protein gp3
MKKPPIKQKYIETPDKLWELFESYKTDLKRKPIKVHDFVGKDGDSVERKKERPLTMEGFQNYLDDNDIITDVTDYFENKGGRYQSYVRICSRIRRKIKQDQIEGGMAGIYNSSITQRLNNLVEKTENKHEVNEIIIKRES